MAWPGALLSAPSFIINSDKYIDGLLCQFMDVAKMVSPRKRIMKESSYKKPRTVVQREYSEITTRKF